MIHLINTKKVNMRLRGKTRGKVMQQMAAAREKVVELVKENKLKVKEKFKAMALSRWRELNPGKDPKTEGYSVQVCEVPGQGAVQCVLMRKAPPLEWDVELELSLGAVIRETHDDGRGRLREGQEASKFAGLSAAIVGSVDVSADSKTYDDLRGKAGKAASAAGPEQTAKSKKEADPASESDSESRSESGEKEDDFLAGSLLGGICSKDLAPVAQNAASKQRNSGGGGVRAAAAKPARASAPKAASRANAAARQSSAQSAPAAGASAGGRPKARSRSRSPLREPCSGEAAAGSSGRTGKARGKGAKIPVGTDEVLRYEGFPQ
eukprot:11199817-Alexandrium_andersonii.AAC.1